MSRGPTRRTQLCSARASGLADDLAGWHVCRFGWTWARRSLARDSQYPRLTIVPTISRFDAHLALFVDQVDARPPAVAPRSPTLGARIHRHRILDVVVLDFLAHGFDV